MIVEDHIRAALARAKASTTVEDIMGMVRRGEASLVCTGRTSMSYRFIEDDEGEALEVMHAYGDYTHEQGFFLNTLGEAMRRRGVYRMTWLGRPGWPRLLGKA